MRLFCPIRCLTALRGGLLGLLSSQGGLMNRIDRGRQGFRNGWAINKWGVYRGGLVIAIIFVFWLLDLVLGR
jgi:hypothetical protein